MAKTDRLGPRWVRLPENRLATCAIRRIVRRLGKPGLVRLPPLVLYGPSGCGKSLAVILGCQALKRLAPERSIQLDTAREWPGGKAPVADWWVIEDMQFLPAGRVETLRVALDAARRRGTVLTLTCSVPPAELQLPKSLVSRLSGGLSVGISPLGLDSRGKLLRRLARSAGLNVEADAIALLAMMPAESARSLGGVIQELQGLNAGRCWALADVQDWLSRREADSLVPRIIDEVARQYGVTPRQLKGSSRLTTICLARQTAMYLAKELTGLPLKRLGGYFGKRDHTTVLHACRKMASLLGTPEGLILAGLLRQFGGCGKDGAPLARDCQPPTRHQDHPEDGQVA